MGWRWLRHPKLGMVPASFVSVAQDTEMQKQVQPLPRSALCACAAHRGSHLSGHGKKYKGFEVSLRVTHIGHLCHTINCPHGANIQEEINSFKGA